MLDFTLKSYSSLLQTLQSQGYVFQPYRDFVISPKDKVIILRHDVDKLPFNSLQTALIEHKMGIVGSYYFRIVKESFNEPVIRTIALLGHETGYHYEDLSMQHGDMQRAYDECCKNLSRLREIVPVMTLTMHGNPLSKWDNRDLWNQYDYRKLGLIGEPYFDLDFTRVLYLTDTGRIWNNFRINIRDKSRTYSAENLHEKYKFRHSSEIMAAAVAGTLPPQIMMTVHPQRWMNKPLPWTKELVIQNLKNLGKRQMVPKR